MESHSPTLVTKRSTLTASIAIIATAAVALVLAANLLAQGEAAGHLRFHAIGALAVLVVAGGLAWRWPSAGTASAAPALGLATFAVGMIVEAIGAIGYAADNETRGSLAAIHDVGVTATSVGMAAMVVGIGVGVGAALARRPSVPRWVAFGASLAVIGPGLLATRIMAAGL